MPSATSRATAGATMVRSSSPSVPFSPACGLSPATASRGRGMRNRTVRSRATIRPVSTIKLGRKMPKISLQRQVDRHRHDGKLRRPQHHHRPQRLPGRLAHQRGQEFGVAGLGKSPIVEHVLGHRIGDDGRGRARQDVGHRAANRGDGRRSARSVGAAGLGGHARHRSATTGKRRRKCRRRRPPA